MKQTINYSFAFAAIILLFASACKKEKNPEIYFTASSSTVDKGGSSTVSIELSEPTNNTVELDLQSTGIDPITFGTYNDVFIRDDSDKMEAKIDPNAFIDTTGHIRIAPGTKSLLITFKTKSDDFPHAPASYTMKMVSAKNASIRSGSDSYTYNINQSNAEYHFTSTIAYRAAEHDTAQYGSGDNIFVVDTMKVKFGTFVMTSFSYTKNGTGNYDLQLNYGAPLEGATTKVSSITINYPNIPSFELGDNIIDCNNSTPTITYNPPKELGEATTDMITLSCGDLFKSAITAPVKNSINGSPSYGDFLVFDGKMDIGKSTPIYFRENPSVIDRMDTLSLKGNVNSQFIVYKK